MAKTIGQKTRASCDSVPVIRQLAEILDNHRKSTGNPQSGVVFQSGNGLPVHVRGLTRRIRHVREKLTCTSCELIMQAAVLRLWLSVIAFLCAFQVFA